MMIYGWIDRVQTSCSRRSLSTLSYPARIGPLCRLSTAIQPTSSWIQPPQKSQCSTIASSGRSCNSSHRRRAVSEQQQQQQPSPHSYSHSLLQQRRRSSIATKAYNNTVDLVAKESYATDKVGRVVGDRRKRQIGAAGTRGMGTLLSPFAAATAASLDF